MFDSIVDFLKSVGDSPEEDLYSALNFKEGAKFNGVISDFLDSYPFGSTVFDGVFADSQFFSEGQVESLKVELDKRFIEYEEDDRSIPLCCDYARSNSKIFRVKNTENEFFVRIVSKAEIFGVHTYAFMDLSGKSSLFSERIMKKYANLATKLFRDGKDVPVRNFSDSWFVAPHGYAHRMNLACSNCFDDLVNRTRKEILESVDKNVRFNDKYLIGKKYVAEMIESLRFSYRRVFL